MNQDLLILGRVIKEVRKANDLNQGEFAEITGVSQPSIVAYESGKTEPSFTFLKNVRENFGYNLLDEDITKLIIEKTYDKETRKPIKKEKSGATITPDFQLLTLIKKQVDELKVNFDTLFSPEVEQPKETSNLGYPNEDFLKDKSRITGKR